MRDYIEAKPVLYCCDKAFTQWPRDMGVGIEALQACETKACPTCARKVKAEDGVDLPEM